MATKGRGSAVEWTSDDADRSGDERLSIDTAQLEDLPGAKRKADDALEIGDVFELLKNERRRRIITLLKEQDDGVSTLNVLAEHIAALENDIDVAQLSSSQRKRVYIGLYQCHLPKLDEYGVIEFRKNRGIVRLRDTSQLEPYLTEAAKSETETESEATDGTGSDESGTTADDRVEATSSISALSAGAVGSDLFAASAIAVGVLLGMSGIGALATVPSGLWTAFSLAALLWFARD
jgi:hypothetical protein